MLKSRILGQNPCNIDRIFRRIKQFGGPSRQGAGVSGVEIALWDLAGKAYGVPVYQMLGGRFRDRIRLYCDTDVEGRNTSAEIGKALKARMNSGYTFLKMDMGIELLLELPGTLNAPLGLLEEMKKYSRHALQHKRGSLNYRSMRGRAYELFNLPHSFTFIQITPKGLDVLEQYLAGVRSLIGYEIPLAIDHIGHIGLSECIKLAHRLGHYNLGWMEDPLPWPMTDLYVQLHHASTIPLCTGEDIYLKEGFLPLLKSGGIDIIHPDLLTAGGIMETKKIGDLAQEHGVPMAMHMSGSPVACMAAVHTAAATENFLALEMHSVDVPWWLDLVTGLPEPLIRNGHIAVPNTPGLGIESLNDDVIREHLHPDHPKLWEPTDEWDNEWSNDRQWA
jgi:L-alanine-DL-glutamate epimerase-like enolase superfamily enzyme